MTGLRNSKLMGNGNVTLTDGNMNKEEIGRMDARLHEIALRVRDDMPDDQIKEAVEDMAGYMIDTNKRLARIELLIGYVEHNIRLDI